MNETQEYFKRSMILALILFLIVASTVIVVRLIVFKGITDQQIIAILKRGHILTSRTSSHASRDEHASLEEIGQISGIAIDMPSRKIYIADMKFRQIKVYSLDGKFERSIGHPGTDREGFSTPIDVEVGPKGIVFVVDYEQARVKAFTPMGKFLWSVGGVGNSPANFSFPTGLGLDGLGNIYVADSGNHRVQKLSEDGSFKLAFGGKGVGPGEFSNPFDVAVGPNGFVYVTDMGNGRIQKFDANGNFVGEWGTQYREYLKKPMYIYIDSRGNVYVTDKETKLLLKFSSGGKLLGIIGRRRLKYPLDIAGFSGLILVSDFKCNDVFAFYQR